MPSPSSTTIHPANPSLVNATLFWFWALLGTGLTIGLWPAIGPLLQVALVMLLLGYLLLWPINWLEKGLLGILALGARLIGRPLASHPQGGFSRRWSVLIRGFAIGIVFLGFGIGLAISITVLVPLLIAQGKVFVANVPGQLVQLFINSVDWLNTTFGLNVILPIHPAQLTGQEDEVASWLSTYLADWLQQHTQWIQDTMGQTTQRLWLLVTSTVQGVVTTLLVIAGVFFSLLYGPTVTESAVHLIPSGEGRAQCRAGLAATHRVMLGFLRGQVLLGVITGIYMGIVYALFGVPYALLLAVGFAIVEILPVIGTWLGIIPGLLIAWISGGFWVAFGVWVCSYVYQTIKDNIVAPKVVGDIMGLHPMAIVVAILVFGKVGGLLGVVYAIPVCALLWLGWQHHHRLHSPQGAT